MSTSEVIIDMDRKCSCGKYGVTPSGLCLECIGRRLLETGEISQRVKVKGNVSKENSTISIEVAYIAAVSADFVKGQMVVKLTLKLDESALSVRDELGYIAFDDSPVRVMITNVQGKLL